jgi:hypothetical protein
VGTESRAPPLILGGIRWRAAGPSRLRLAEAEPRRPLSAFPLRPREIKSGTLLAFGEFFLKALMTRAGERCFSQGARPRLIESINTAPIVLHWAKECGALAHLWREERSSPDEV